MSRSITIKDEILSEGKDQFGREFKRAIRYELFYSKGGNNCFTYKNENRGYYLSIKPVKLSEGCVSFIVMQGRKLLVKEANRFSLKTLNQLAQTCLSDNKDIVENMRNIALNEE